MAIILFAVACAVSLAFPAGSQAQSQSQSQSVTVIEFERAVTPVSARYLRRELNAAFQSGSQLAVITLDTPGGLLDSTRDIVNALLDSQIPTAVYVHPNGAQAASAGTFVGAAANFLVMSPVSNIGAAAPVGSSGEDLGETLAAKAKEDAAALIRSIAERRERNIVALEQTVLEAKSYSASEAVQLGVADFVATDLNHLVTQLNGRSADVNGTTVTLEFGEVNFVTVDYGLLDSIIGFIANPNFAFLLISLGSLALAVELFNIGTWIPGTLGLILLTVGFGGAGQLPFSWVGVALIAFALVLFFVETQVAGFGFFGVVGVVTLVLGGLFLFDFSGSLGGASLSGVSWWVLASSGVVALLIVGWLTIELRKSRRHGHYMPQHTSEKLVGCLATVSSERLDPQGEVFVGGEFWRAELIMGGVALRSEKVKVERVENFKMLVRKPPD